MNREDLIKEIEIFKDNTEELRKLLLDSRDCVGDIVENHDKIRKLRSTLNRIRARLEKFILLFGNNPRMSDGVWNILYPVYDNAFSDDILSRVGPSLNVVLQDQDYIIGKLESIDNKEFNEKIKPVNMRDRTTVRKATRSHKIINNFTNCNVAINSNEFIQRLNITNSEMKKNIKELEKAIEEKNPIKIKKVFGFIVDKAVDVAIALLTNGMTK